MTNQSKPVNIIGKEQDRYRAPALEKGLDILELLASSNEALSQSNIARSLGRSSNEIFRMLSTLVKRRYVTRTDDGDRYTLSLHMFSLAQQHSPIARLLEFARPLMREATQETWQSCHLGTENSGSITIIASEKSPGNWGLVLRVGSVIGLSNTGTGRVLAAFRPETETNLIIERHQLALGEPPIDRDIFFEQLTKIRKQGCYIAPSDTNEGVTNLAFPVFDSFGRAILIVSCPYILRIDDFRVPSIKNVAEAYRKLAAKLTQYYGGTPPVYKGH